MPKNRKKENELKITQLLISCPRKCYPLFLAPENVTCLSRAVSDTDEMVFVSTVIIIAAVYHQGRAKTETISHDICSSLTSSHAKAPVLGYRMGEEG